MHHMGEDAPLLVAQAGPLNGLRWTLVHQMSVGREPTCDIVISDRQVSRKHAMVMAGPDGFILRDLKSKCGTFVNDKRIEECGLNNGDKIRIGEVQLVFRHS